MARPREFDEDQVLDAVMKTFWRQGYEATSAQNLVDATGLGRGSLYAAYTNKEGLFEQAMRRYNRHTHANVDRLRNSHSALAGLRNLLASVAAPEGRRGERGCLATNTAIERAGQDRRVAEMVRENFRIMIGGIQDAIARGQSAGEIAADHDPHALAMFVFNTLQGLRVLARVTPARDRRKLATIIDQTLSILRAR